MSWLQRYVSEELTHFLGRDLDESGQYDLLVQILTTGWITHPPHDPGESGRLFVDPEARLSANEMFAPQVVCFCDIPVGDLHLHMRRFSRFGIAFPKPFLARLGASPVYYVAKHARVPPQHADDRKDVVRAQYFDERVRLYHDVFREVQQACARGEVGFSEDLAERFARVQDFLDHHVFSYVKFFDDSLGEDDPANHYMEREWRILGNVRFDLDDVRRVIVPEAYARRLRRDVPDYVGQVTFVE